MLSSPNLSPSPSAGIRLSMAELQETLADSEVEESEVLQLLTEADVTQNSIADQYDKLQAELDDACEAYIQSHVRNAERISKLYLEYKACEEKVMDFETEILNFQRKLKDTEDIVKMQQQIEDMMMKVKHRQQVSSALNEVYSALQECDAFCESFSGNHQVDENYLSNLRRLGVKLSFLSRHRALQHSAVGDEIRPKLTMAAEQAGERLYRYFAQRIQIMPNASAISASVGSLKDMVAFHLTLEESDNFGFTFLKLYNPPVAQRIIILYVQSAVSYYTQSFSNALQQLKRCGSVPRGSEGTTEARCTQVIRTSLQEWHDGVRAKTMGKHPLKRILKDSDCLAYLEILNAISMKYGNLQFELPKSVPLSHSAAKWLPHFVRYFLLVVNACTSECRFIGNFFCVAETQEGAVENYNDAEQVSRLILESLIQRVQQAMEEVLVQLQNPLDILAALRVIELCKEYVCTSQDPIPLLLLSSLLEVSKGMLRSVLQSSLRKEAQLLDECRSTCLSRSAPVPATLSQPEFVWETFGLLWPIDLLNTAQLSCSTFTAATPKSSDSGADRFCVSASRQVCELLQHLFPAASARLAALHQYRYVMCHRTAPAAPPPKSGTALVRSEQCGGSAKRVWDDAFQRSLLAWVQSSSTQSPTIAELLRSCEEMETKRLREGDSPKSSTSPGGVTAEGDALQAMRSLATRLDATWKTELCGLRTAVRELAAATPELAFADAFTGDVWKALEEELLRTLRQYPNVWSCPPEKEIIEPVRDSKEEDIPEVFAIKSISSVFAKGVSRSDDQAN